MYGTQAENGMTKKRSYSQLGYKSADDRQFLELFSFDPEKEIEKSKYKNGGRR
jgi:hypothetical protein